jgi:hypothetical protein
MVTNLLGNKVCFISHTSIVWDQNVPMVKLVVTPDLYKREIEDSTGTIVAAHTRNGYLIFTIKLHGYFLEATSDMLRVAFADRPDETEQLKKSS